MLYWILDVIAVGAASLLLAFAVYALGVGLHGFVCRVELRSRSILLYQKAGVPGVHVGIGAPHCCLVAGSEISSI